MKQVKKVCEFVKILIRAAIQVNTCKLRLQKKNETDGKGTNEAEKFKRVNIKSGTTANRRPQTA